MIRKKGVKFDNFFRKKITPIRIIPIRITPIKITPIRIPPIRITHHNVSYFFYYPINSSPHIPSVMKKMLHLTLLQLSSTLKKCFIPIYFYPKKMIHPTLILPQKNASNPNASREASGG